MTKSAKKNKPGAQLPKIDEATHLKLLQIIDDFGRSDHEVYTFEAGLTNPQRAFVHILSRKRGMMSKSQGKGAQRCVSVYKKKKHQQNGKEKKNVPSLTFSQESREVLQDLFTRYPPCDGEQNEEMVTDYVGEVDKRLRVKDDSFQKPSMSKAEISRKVASLASKMKKTASLRQIFEGRSKLPIASFKDAITSTVEANQVVLISGETGCGKTTQVPQYLLDYVWGKGERCKIVCTQPRRISAISVAERIAYERGENVGDDIGYKIRLETKGGKQSSVMFCTNGILLRVLVGKGVRKTKPNSEDKKSQEGSLELTHIIVDEIHERDRFSDFILAILRDMLPSYPNLRLILMSATLDAHRFSEYFGGCPVIRVPGFTYPVKSFYLEDILSIVKSTDNNHLESVQDADLTEDYTSSLDEAISSAWSSDEFDPLRDLISTYATPKVYNYQHSVTGVYPLMAFAGSGKVSDVCMLLSLGANCELRAKDGRTAMDLAELQNQGEIVEIIQRHIENVASNSLEEQDLLEKYLATINPENVDITLIERLLKKICSDSDEGAILIFLPGWDDINKTREKLLASPYFKDSWKFVLISLHSMVPSAEQKKVFKRPPKGSRKIILSTNIAETAVTIDDVVYVIDSGRMKEKSYDPYNNVSTLHSSWVSKASARQREGRAGRCQPGICYHLYSKARAESLPDFQVPEIKRMPIEELCLQVKLLDRTSKIIDFLQKTLDPPVFETVRNAILLLQEIGALSPNEDLTELGEKLGSLPVHPSTSKMLFFAILMNCLDPALTLACASDNRDPFILPINPIEKKKAIEAKAELASLYGGHSDQLIIIAAYECWKSAKDKGQEELFCSKYFLSSNTMNMLASMRVQLQRELIRNGFVQEDVSRCSLNAGDIGILHAVLVAGVYPRVGRLLPPKGGQRFVVETTSGAKVRLNPSSSNYRLSNEKSKSQPLVIYDEITRGDGGMYIRSCSVVGPYPLLMLAKEMVVAPADNEEEDEDEEEEECFESESDEDGMAVDVRATTSREHRIMANPDNNVSVVIDRWLTFELTALDVAQIYCLRERLHAAILFKVKNPKKILTPDLGAAMYAIACILSYDGLSGIPDTFKSITENETEIKASSFLKSLLSAEVPNNRPRHNKPRQKQELRQNQALRNTRRETPANPNLRHPPQQYVQGHFGGSDQYQQPPPFSGNRYHQPPPFSGDLYHQPPPFGGDRYQQPPPPLLYIPTDVPQPYPLAHPYPSQHPYPHPYPYQAPQLQNPGARGYGSGGSRKRNISNRQRGGRGSSGP
ncbi:RNA helicase [Ranunculus cassubicifolius]